MEARVAKPSDNRTQFHQDTGNEVDARFEQINTDAGDDLGLYGPDQNQQTGAPQGNINYPPSYGSCP